MTLDELQALINQFYAATRYNLFDFVSGHYKRGYTEPDKELLKALNKADLATSTQEMYDSWVEEDGNWK